MGVRTAQKTRMQHAWNADIVNVAPLTGEEPPIFQPRMTRSDDSGFQLIARMAFWTTSLGVA